MSVLTPPAPVVDRAALQPHIDQFRQGLAQQRQSLWVQADAAAAIFQQAGEAGIQVLAAEVGLSAKWCYDLAQIALQFPQESRDRHAALPVTYFREALAAARGYPPESPASRPEFWLSYMETHGLNRDGLRFAARHWAPAVDAAGSPADRQEQLLARLGRADAARSRIETLVGLYNRMFSGLTGAVLVITERPV